MSRARGRPALFDDGRTPIAVSRAEHAAIEDRRPRRSDAAHRQPHLWPVEDRRSRSAVEATIDRHIGNLIAGDRRPSPHGQCRSDVSRRTSAASRLPTTSRCAYRSIVNAEARNGMTSGTSSCERAGAHVAADRTEVSRARTQDHGSRGVGTVDPAFRAVGWSFLLRRRRGRRASPAGNRSAPGGFYRLRVRFQSRRRGRSQMSFLGLS